jgi:hypothetical protein
MIAMLAPDLLDRRALGLLELVDIFGAPLRGFASVTGEGLRIYRKEGGRFAILAAAGLETHERAFDAVPGTPALRSKRFNVDIRPDDRRFAPRRAEIRLPRDPDPANRGNATSLFSPMAIELLPAPNCPVPANAASVRVTVRSGGLRVEGALVRVASENGQFSGRAVTDAAGEALVIVPHFPMSFTGNNASVSAELAGSVSVVADPDNVVLRSDAELGAAGAQPLPHPVDPDVLTAMPVPAGVPVTLSARATRNAVVEWAAP